MKRNYYTLVGLALIALPAWGQAQTQPKDSTVSRTVIVEQEYTPSIRDASKINVLPPVIEPIVSKKAVEYALTPTPSSSIPANQMQIYTGKEVQPTTWPGVVRLGYGNYGNLDILGNYLFRLSSKDRLNVNFNMDGMDGKLDNLPYQTETKWNAFYYRTRANVDYIHQFKKMDLNVAADFGLSNFNFKPESVNSKQKFTSGSMKFGLASTTDTQPLQFNVETGLMLYQRQHNLDFGASPKETQVRTHANVSGGINDEQRIHVALTMNNVFYKQVDFTDHTMLNLNPYYELRNDNWQLHLGAHLDLAFGHGKGVRISPDLIAQYAFSDSYVLYAKATGGEIETDFRKMEQLNPYAEFALIDGDDNLAPRKIKQLEDTYEQLNTSLGFKASPYPGVWFNLYGGYQSLKDMVYNEVASPTPSASYLAFAQSHAHNTYVGAEVSYNYKEIISLSATGTYRNWSADEALALYIQPATELNFNATVRPIKPLSIHAGYQYVGRKKLAEYGKMAPVSDLRLGASYQIFKGVSAYVQVNNLLNKTYQYYLGYATEGLNYLGGLSFQF